MISAVYDADWVQESGSQKLISGFVMMVTSRSVNWRSRQQSLLLKFQGRRNMSFFQSAFRYSLVERVQGLHGKGHADQSGSEDVG